MYEPTVGEAFLGWRTTNEEWSGGADRWHKIKIKALKILGTDFDAEATDI